MPLVPWVRIQICVHLRECVAKNKWNLSTYLACKAENLPEESV
jgi:hypothetical protein